MTEITHYEILGVAATASGEEIKAAHRRQAMRFHPDLNPGDRTAEERSKQINAAYDVLKDPEKRRRYDDGLEARRSQQRRRQEEQAAEQRRRAEAEAREERRRQAEPAGGAGGSGGWDADRDLDEVLREAMRRSGPGRGDIPLKVTLEDLMERSEHEVLVPDGTACRACGGSGHGADCPDCSGHGRRDYVQGGIPFEAVCRRCEGRGVLGGACGECEGTGMRAAARVRVAVPAGARDGDVFEIAAGTLRARVVLVVEPHPVWRRRGADLEGDLAMAPEAAAEGCVRRVVSPDGGALEVRVPAGTAAGARLRVRGKGLPDGQGGRGDLHLVVRAGATARDAGPDGRAQPRRAWWRRAAAL